MAQNEIKFVNEANLRRYTKKVKTADDAASRTVESEATGSGTTGEFPLHLNHTAYSSSNPGATATKDKVYIDNNLRYNPVTHELKITDGTNTATFSPTGGDAGDFTGTTTVGITAGTSSAAPKVKVKVGSSDEATSGEITKATTEVWGVTKLLGSITNSTTQAPTSGAVKTELDKKVDSTALASHTGTSDGSTLVGYSSSQAGYTSVTTVDGALDQLITDVKAAQDTADINEIMILTGNELLSLGGGFDVSGASYQTVCQKIADSINTTVIATADIGGVVVLEQQSLADSSNDGCTEFTLTLRRGTESSTFAMYFHSKKVNGTWTKQSDQKVKVNQSSTERSLAGYVSEGMLNTALSEKVDTMVVNVEASASSLDHITIDSIDKTYTEIGASIQAGKTVIARVELTGNINGTMILSTAIATTGDIMFEGSYLLFGLWSVILSITATNDTFLNVHQLQLVLNSTNAGDNISIATDASTDDIKISALDEKVNQTATSESADIPMLLASGATPSNGGAKYDTDLKYNPSTNTLKLGTGTLTATNYSGTSAKATADGSGNDIVSTYATKSALDALTQKWTGQFVVLKSTGDTAEKYTALNNILAAIAAGQTPAAADLAKLDLGYIYLLENGSGTNVYDEYIKVAKGTSPETYSVEKIGTTDAGVDVVSLTDAEIDSIWANPDAA